MDELTKRLMTVATIVLSGAGLVWSVWMIRRHYFKPNPATKHRRTETMMMQPVVIGLVPAPFAMVIVALLALDALKGGTADWKEFFLALGVGLPIAVFLVCYGTRQIIIYDYDRLRYRPAVGRMRTYDFSQIRSMTPIAFDLLVHAGRRWILIDAQQDWHPLWENYRSWRKRNGLPVKERTYKTALGRAFGQIPGGIGAMLTLVVFMAGCAAGFIVFAVMSFRGGQVGPAVVFLLFAAAMIVTIVLMLFTAAHPEKNPRLTKLMLGDLKKWGAPRQKRTGTERKDKTSGDKPEKEKKKP